MALSKRAKDAIKRAVTDAKAADELILEIEASADPQLDSMAAVGALAPVAASISASAGTYAIPAEPTGAEVDAAIDELRDKVETALDLKADNADLETLRAAFDALVADLKAKGLMLP